MRKSSKGNPNHWPAGSPKGGQFAPKGMGVEVVRNQAYYDARTKYRMGEMSEEDYVRTISVESVESKTPIYDEFAKKILVDVSNPNSKKQSFRNVCKMAGVECNVPIRMTQGRRTTGTCRYALSSEEDGVHKKAQSVTLSGAQGEAEQIDTLYHEAFHFCANNGVTDCKSFDGFRWTANSESQEMEEVMAVCSAHALCKDTGVETDKLSYSIELADKLPRLKHCTEKFKDCNTIAEVGRIAWSDRIEKKDSHWGELNGEIRKGGLPRGYYKPYVEHIRQNRERIVDDIVRKCGVSKDNTAFRSSVTGWVSSGCDLLERGYSPKSLTGNQKIAVCDALMFGFREMGIL